MDTDKIRKACKKLMIDLDFHTQGGQKKLSKELSIEKTSLNFALNGVRDTQVYSDILFRVHEYLLKLS
jgi:hypothetical protein